MKQVERRADVVTDVGATVQGSSSGWWRSARSRPARRSASTAAALALVAVTAGCEPLPTDPAEPAGASSSGAVVGAPESPAPPAPSASSTAGAGTAPSQDQTGNADEAAGAGATALAALAELEVKGRAPMTGYDRDRFGQAWLDADRNGCDTRNDTLGRDLTDVVHAPGTRDCKVTSGRLNDPYTRDQVDFVYGDGALVDIDHVVALGNAWVTGASGWDITKRAAVANDPLNLLSVNASANRQKGDADAATWLPPNKTYRCDYVARQVTVKAKYGLWVTAPERDAMTRILNGCPGQPLAEDSGAPLRVTLDVTDPGDPDRGPAGSGPSAGSAAGGGDAGRKAGSATSDGWQGWEQVSFEDCDAARAAGAAPVRRGDPGYGSHLDRDGDGSACE